jgi:hypothetical protein
MKPVSEGSSSPIRRVPQRRDRALRVHGGSIPDRFITQHRDRTQPLDNTQAIHGAEISVRRSRG